MTAADKIEDARALIKPLPVVKDGPWAVRAHWSHEEKREVYPTYSGKEPFAGEWTAIAEVEAHADDDGAASEEIARLIAAAPALRDTVAALADLADALAQENARLLAENERMRKMRFNCTCPDPDECGCDNDMIVTEHASEAEARAALQADEAAQ